MRDSSVIGGRVVCFWISSFIGIRQVIENYKPWLYKGSLVLLAGGLRADR